MPIEFNYILLTMYSQFTKHSHLVILN